MALQIRPMQPAEHDTITRIFHDVWHETQARLQDPRRAKLRDIAFFRGRVEMADVHTLVAAVDNDIVGFTRWSSGNLHSLFVRSGHRSKGIGEMLCTAAIQANNIIGGGPMVLDCVEGNYAARRFYERLGWRVKETLESKDEIAEGQIHTRYWIMVNL